MSETKTALHANPFHVLQVSTRDNTRRIVEAAEERSLFIDHDTCQKARFSLANPRTRLASEIAWMPGLAPRMVENLIATLGENPLFVRTDNGLPELARANLMAAACELVEKDESAVSVAQFIRDFTWVVEAIDVDDVMRDINEDRGISGFPEVRSREAIEDELGERRKAYCTVLKNLLDGMDSTQLVETLTDAVSVATAEGEVHGPALLDDLVDSYEVEAQGFLQKEYENMAALIRCVRDFAPRGQVAVAAILDKLELVARNWDWVARPIQVSAKSRGIVHRQSREVALELRGLGIELNNDHGLLEQSHQMTQLLREIFAELPEVAERLEEDAEAIAKLRSIAEERSQSEAEWARAVTFRADVGSMFRGELAISPEGIRWKGQTFPLDSITRVRWGGVRHSLNGIPTGTTYTIAFGDNRTERVIELRDESIYNGFLEALWRGVCVRLMIQMLQALSEGRSLSFGDIMVEDDAVTVNKHKFLGTNERVRLTWDDVQVWSAAGSFAIGHKSDKKIYGLASYIEAPNTHVIEHVIRGGFKKGVSKLSDYLTD